VKNIIVEGARGLGKTSITKYIREHTTNSTLINFTGFNEGGEEGLNKVKKYYAFWERFFEDNKDNNSEFLFIHDRYYFSEMVYSSLYKDYDFRPHFDYLVDNIPEHFDEVTLVVLYGGAQDISRNLNRDKVELFGKVDESLQNSLIQQLEYLKMAKRLDERNIPNLTVKVLDCTGKSIQEIGNEIIEMC
jgi:deoxyguanosine kinase